MWQSPQVLNTQQTGRCDERHSTLDFLIGAYQAITRGEGQRELNLHVASAPQIAVTQEFQYGPQELLVDCL